MNNNVKMNIYNRYECSNVCSKEYKGIKSFFKWDKARYEVPNHVQLTM